MTSTLDQIPVTTLTGVGPSVAIKLKNLSIYNVQDVLFHLPLHYQDRTRVTPIGALRSGMHVVIEGQLLASDIVFGRRRSLLCRLQDGSGTLSLRFFHFNTKQRQQLSNGIRMRCFGEVRLGSTGFELYHPEYIIIDATATLPLATSLTPVYPTTEGLAQNRIRQITGQALALLNKNHSLIDYLPNNILAHFTDIKSLPSLHEALHYLHRPPTNAQIEQLETGTHPAQLRLVFEELLAHHLSLLHIKSRIQKLNAPPMQHQRVLTQQFLKQLPFTLTGAQQRAVIDIERDLQKKIPMHRLVQGDVGSGKTVVAALAALQAIENNFQVVFMAPTEILAEQHELNFEKWFTPLGIKLAWLSSKLTKKQRDQQLASISNGEAQFIIGTHALFQRDVAFHNLGLVIIDEQHRFGVDQRMTLRNKGVSESLYPHQLIMTATPIPRTLAMSAYADMDATVIDELPPGRTPVTTSVIADDRRPDIIARVRKACLEGKQAYWVCTLIEESEALECQAAEATAQELITALPELSIGLIHGRLKPAEKTLIMDQFKKGELHLLVATTVIEVGVDVPNASLMIIENPERLGLAQLHQLRGRVGRGTTASHCVLLYHPPLSFNGKARLAVMRDHHDGFIIAEEDLRLRGPGELLGTKQSGLAQLKIADLVRDAQLLPIVKSSAELLLKECPHVVKPLIARWLTDKTQYAQV